MRRLFSLCSILAFAALLLVTGTSFADTTATSAEPVVEDPAPETAPDLEPLFLQGGSCSASLRCPDGHVISCDCPLGTCRRDKQEGTVTCECTIGPAYFVSCDF